MSQNAIPPGKSGLGKGAITRRQWRILGITASAGFFENYDRALLALALQQIQAGLRISEQRLGGLLSLIRLGYLFALPIATLADRLGRRQVLLYTVAVYSLATGASALAPNAASFVACQIVARAAAAAEAAVALVIVTEELDAHRRGLGVGLLGALGACGYGLAALGFALIGVLPGGWRGLYALALPPLALLIPIRRMLPETIRFVAGSRHPLAGLLRRHPRRLRALLAITFLSYLGGSPATALAFKYLQEVHHWRPPQVSALVVLGGALGILGNIVAGRSSDRLGRRTMAAVFMLLAPLLMLLFLHSAGPLMIGAWVLELFCDTASTTLLNTFGAELFATSHRATAASAVTVAATLGAALGLWLEAILFGLCGSHWRAVSLLTIFWLASAVLIWGLLPETAGLELEAIAESGRD